MYTTIRPMTKRLLAALVLLVALALTIGFAGCEWAPLLLGDRQTDTTTKNPDKLSPTLSEDTNLTPEYLHPLTGLESTAEDACLRPVSICIGNTSNALPQFALGSADMLVEVPIEGGFTRLMLLTTNYKNLEKAGSVRATRNYLARIAAGFDAVQFYAGTVDTGQSTTLPYDTMDYLTQILTHTYYPDQSRSAPHNLMTDGTRIAAGLSTQGYRTTLDEQFTLPFVFSEYGKTRLPAERSANALKITFSSVQEVEFAYQPSTKTYLRDQMGEAHLDGGDNQQLAFTNLFILYSDAITYEGADGSTLELNLSNGGSGYYCYGGMAQQITWTMDENNHMSFYDAGGQLLTVNRGNSYIGFVKAIESHTVIMQ